MNCDGFKINKESVEKIFPKRDIGDIDLSGYKSPIEVMIERINGQIEYEARNAVYKELRRIDVEVDKNELIKALRYDRGQYEKGYFDGYNNGRKTNEWKKITYKVDEYGSLVFDENQPPFNEFVNVYCPENNCVYTAYWSYSDREWKIPSVTTNETMRLEAISHWMPTPKPPKER